MVSDPHSAERTLGDSKAVKTFEGACQQIATPPSELYAYRDFFTMIMQQKHRPALIHCTTGEDPTGWTAPATLFLLGVDEQDVPYDHTLTNRNYQPAMKSVFEYSVPPAVSRTCSNRCLAWARTTSHQLSTR